MVGITLPNFDPEREELVIGTSNPMHYRVIPIVDRSKLNHADTARRILAAGARLNEFSGQAYKRLPTTPFAVRARFVHNSGALGPDTEIDWSGISLPVEIAPELSPLASEVVHHFRTALEYLVFNMVWADTGTRPTEWVKVPCYKTKDVWQNKQKTKPLSQLSVDSRAALEAVQPFSGTAWLAQLTELSNSDKHQSPIYVVPGIQWGMPAEMVLGRWVEIVATPRLMIRVKEEQLDFLEVAQRMLRGIVDLANPVLVREGWSPITLTTPG